MKRTHAATPSLALALAAAVCLAACQRAGPARVSRPLIVPLGPTDAAPAQAAPAAVGMQLTPAQPQPRITIDLRDTVLQVVTASLKPAPGEEQVIAVKRMSEVDSPVRLIVVDLDPERGTYYFQSWESPTNATDNRVFSFGVKDLIGDHDVQLVASGMNRDGKLTLDVFRRTPAPRGKELYYKPVCQIVADDIRLQDVERPDSYANDQKNGDSVPIDAYLHDPDSQNVTDLIKITYQWNPAEGRYTPGPPAKVQGEQAGQEQLTKLFNSPATDAFEDFLAGSWVEMQADAAHPASDSYVSLISFDPRARKISLSSGDTQEVYQWRDSLRTIYNRIYLIGDNDTVPQISRTFAVTALTAGSISISMQGNDTGETPAVTYMKIGEDLQAKLLVRAGATTAAPQLSLTGVYDGANGLSVEFHNPRLVWRKGGVRRTAVYVIFPVRGRNVLSARFIGPDGSAGEDQSWLVDFREKKDAAGIVRDLLLSPVQLTVKGYEDAAGDALSLEQELDLRPK